MDGLETPHPPTDPMRPPSAVDTPGGMDQGWVTKLGCRRQGASMAWNGREVCLLSTPMSMLD